MEPALRPATYADVLGAPEGLTAELFGGELHLSPRPAVRHVDLASGLTAELRTRFGRQRGGHGPGGWWILAEPELHLGGDANPQARVLVPDLAGWRRERLPVLPDAPALTLCPDWACEILSPGPANMRRDRVLKPDHYAAVGVAWLWFVDPAARLLEVWRLQGGTYARVQAFGGDDRARAEPFDAVELELGGWWMPEDAPAAPATG